MGAIPIGKGLLPPGSMIATALFPGGGGKLCLGGIFPPEASVEKSLSLYTSIHIQKILHIQNMFIVTRQLVFTQNNTDNCVVIKYCCSTVDSNQ